MAEQDSSQLVAHFAKNSREEVRISIDVFKGKKLVNMRVFYFNGDTDTYLPGKQGMAISVEKFDVLMTSLKLVQEQLAKK